MEWEIFFGRFHTLLVHLPIGILLLAYLFECLFILGAKKIISSRSVIISCYFIGFLSCIMAAISGYLLSFHEVYGIDAINQHKNFAIGSLIVVAILVIIQWKFDEGKKLVKIIASTLAISMLAITGHFGGNLTHGPDYLLEYGPTFLQKTAISQEEINKDSLAIYPYFIKPIFDDNCIACHKSENFKGGLNLDNYGDLFKEADSDLPIQKGHPLKSEIFTRVTLSSDDKEYMPPEKAGLSFTEIEILKYWIQNGADSTSRFLAETMSPELIELLARDYGIDYSPKSYFEKVELDSIEVETFEKLRNSGFKLNYLSDIHFLLDVEFLKDTLLVNDLDQLNSIADHTTFLDLSDSQLTDEMLAQLKGMEHLTRLNLSNNGVSESIPAFVKNSQHLESINLNGTPLTTEQLSEILRVVNLKSIYVMNSGISDEELASLRQQFQATEVISSFQFEEVEKSKSVFEKQAEEVR